MVLYFTMLSLNIHVIHVYYLSFSYKKLSFKLNFPKDCFLDLLFILMRLLFFLYIFYLSMGTLLFYHIILVIHRLFLLCSLFLLFLYQLLFYQFLFLHILFLLLFFLFQHLLLFLRLILLLLLQYLFRY